MIEIKVVEFSLFSFDNISADFNPDRVDKTHMFDDWYFNGNMNWNRLGNVDGNGVRNMNGNRMRHMDGDRLGNRNGHRLVDGHWDRFRDFNCVLYADYVGNWVGGCRVSARKNICLSQIPALIEPFSGR